MGELISILVAVLGGGMVVIAIREVRTKGAAAAMQLAAVGLLLMGASATGLVRLVTQLAFNPLAWVGIGLLSLAGVLFVVGQKLEGPSEKPKKIKKAEQKQADEQQPAVEESPKRKGKDKASARGDEDMDDIQAILRRHGIE